MQSKRLELVVLRFHPGAHSVGNCASCLCLCYKGDPDFKRKFIFDFRSKLFELTEFISARYIRHSRSAEHTPNRADIFSCFSLLLSPIQNQDTNKIDS